MPVPLDLLVPFLAASVLVTVIPGADRAVLPQTLTLVAIRVVVGLIWLSAYARLVQRARGVLAGPRVKARLERTTGALLVALGLRVAVERR